MHKLISITAPAEIEDLSGISRGLMEVSKKLIVFVFRHYVNFKKKNTKLLLIVVIDHYQFE